MASSPTLVLSIDRNPARRSTLHTIWSDGGWQAVERTELVDPEPLPSADLIVLASADSEAETFALLDQLQANSATASVPVLLLAESDPGEQLAAAVAGCLIWPTPPSVLRATARAIIRANRSARLLPFYAALAAEEQLIIANRQAEQALQESEARFRVLAEHIDAVLWLATPRTDGGLYISPAFARIWGRDPQEAVGNIERFISYVYPADRALIEQTIVQNATGQPTSVEYRIVRPDGTLRWIWDRAFPVCDDSGQVIQIAGIATDITARKQTEEQLQLLGTVIDQAGEGIIITNQEAQILYVNPAFERITGYHQAEVLGMNPRFLQSGRHDHAFYQQLWDTITSGEIWHGRFTNRKKNGALYIEDTTITPVRRADNQITHYVAIKRDITHELALTEHVHQAQKMEAIGRLASGIAHDFNNLLMVINIASELLLESQTDSDLFTREQIEAIRQAGSRGAILTRQLLTFARRQHIQPELLNLNKVVKEATGLLERLLGNTVQIEISLAPTLDPIYADAGQITQVLLNLAINARDAMPTGGTLSIRTEQARLSTDNALAVRLTVSDNGSGMDAVVQAHLFEPFFTTKEPGKGTGLGMTTVYGIVTQSGGQIEVESAPGQGTRVMITLPLSIPPEQK